MLLGQYEVVCRLQSKHMTKDQESSPLGLKVHVTVTVKDGVQSKHVTKRPKNLPLWS